MVLLDQLKNAMAVHRKLRVTVWDPEDPTFEYAFDSYILDHEGLNFKMAAPPPSAQRVFRLLTEGMVVGMVMESAPNPFIFYPKVRVYEGRNLPGFWMKIPSDTEIQTVQRRRYVRVPMTVPIKVEHRVVDEEENYTFWDAVQATTEDVSAGGLRFTSERRFEQGEDIRIRIQFSSETPSLLLEGKVVFSIENKIKRKRNEHWVTACYFVDVDANSESVIVRECFKRELELSR